MFSEQGNNLVRGDFAGVDGCPAGWFSFGMRCSGEREMEYEPPVVRSFKELPENPMAAEPVLVNIRSGLPEVRGCDREGEDETRPENPGQVSSQPRQYVLPERRSMRPEIKHPPMRLDRVVLARWEPRDYRR